MVSALNRSPDSRATDMLALQAERVAARYAPAYVVVDQADDVVLFSGDTARFLDPAGSTTLHLPSLVHRDITAELRTLLCRARESGTVAHASGLVIAEPGGASRLSMVVEPLPAADASAGRLMVLFRDERQGQMLAELQHRVKNILAVVRSLLTRTLESSTDLDHFGHHFAGRLGALARSQAAAARTPERLVMLGELVTEEIVSHCGQDERQTHVDGPDVALSEKMAGSIGLAMHELTTNAVKYGGLSVPTGQIAVRWRLEPADASGSSGTERLTLDWQETGVPITDLSPRRRGFGRELIEQGLPYELGATTTLEFRPGGMHCRIVLERPTLPVAQVNAW